MKLTAKGYIHRAGLRCRKGDRSGALADLDRAIEAARDSLDQAGITVHDVDRVVFVGGPTQYKPLRDKVAFELGIAASTDVNPMTAVAEGAAIFAECVHAAGLPKGVFQLVAGFAPDIAAEFLENRRCRKILFTGST